MCIYIQISNWMCWCCLQDIPTGADSCVTSLACDSVGKSLLIAGCGDGSVRLYDRRLPPSDRYLFNTVACSVLFLDVDADFLTLHSPPVEWWPSGSTLAGWPVSSSRKAEMGKSSVAGKKAQFREQSSEKCVSFTCTWCCIHSVSGDVRFWDPRFSESVKKVETKLPSCTAMEVHQQASVFAR